jgi:hypothetical protein
MRYGRDDGRGKRELSIRFKNNSVSVSLMDSTETNKEGAIFWVNKGIELDTSYLFS